jgi:hypothetical protein
MASFLLFSLCLALTSATIEEKILGKFRSNGSNNWYVSNGDEAYMIGQIRREIESAQPKTLAQMESDHKARLARDSNTRRSNRHWTAFVISILFWPSLILWIQPMGNLWGPFLVGLAQWFVIDLVWCWLSRQRYDAKQRRAERSRQRARTVQSRQLPVRLERPSRRS